MNCVRIRLVLAAVGMTLVLLSTSTAQEEFELWFGGQGKWTNDDNWTFNGEPSGAPSRDFERGAQINGGTVIIDDNVDTGGLLFSGGTIDIQSGSLLSDETDFQSGITNLNGTLRLAPGTSFTGPDVKVQGNAVVELLDPTSRFEAKGDLSLGGNLQLTITSGGSPNIKVGGDATISANISPIFDGVVPAFGDSFTFLSGADSVTLKKAAVTLPQTVALPLGLEAFVATTDGSAALTIGNVPVVDLNRATGAATISNVAGGPLTFTGYSLESARGLLDKSFTGIGAGDWDRPNPQDNILSEFSLTGERTLELGESIDIGKAYNGGPTAPLDEDVVFSFVTPNGSLREGIVQYSGPANDIVLNVNPQTGEATIYHRSAFVEPADITGYSVLSPSGGLLPDNWTSFADTGLAGEGWDEAGPSANALSELNLESSKTFENGTVISLGNIFSTGGLRDLELLYTTQDALLTATVEYGDLPVPIPTTIDGDINGDGEVSFADFLILSSNFGTPADPLGCCGDINKDGDVGFPDFLILSTNFGKSVAAETAAVPEPGSGTLLGLGGLLLLAGWRRRTRLNSSEKTMRPQRTVVSRIPCTVCISVSALLAISLGGPPALAQPDGELTINFGEVRNIEGPNDIESIRNPENVIYAINLWGEELERTVNGVTFISDNENVNPDGIPGYRTDWTHTVTNWQAKPEFGDTESDNELEEIMSDIRWTDNSAGGDTGVGSHFEVSAGTQYTLELLISGNHNENRIWDIYIDDELAVSEFDSTNYEEYDPGVVYSYIHTFPAVDNELNVTFNQVRRAGIDGNAILQAAILAIAGPPLTPGDFNDDGSVNIDDYLVMVSNFHKTDASFADGDINFSRRVDLADFAEFRKVFESQPLGAAGVPEPASMMPILVGALMLLGLRRRRRGWVGTCAPARKSSSLMLLLVAMWTLFAFERNAEAQVEIILGEIKPITGPADIVTLRQPENVVYAVNVWGEQLERSVNGITFISDREDVNPDGIDGYRHDWTHTVTNWQAKPEFGDTVDDDNLEEIMSDIRWTNNSAGGDTGVGSHFAVTPNTEYTLELLISGNHEENRIWDIYLEDELAVDEFQSNNYEPYDPGIVWSFTHTFIAPDDEYSVTFNQGTTGSDGNAILQAAILAIAGEGVTPGDFNDDDVVDRNDYNILVSNFRLQPAGFEQGDINFDRIVDLEDFLQFRQIFNSQGAVAAAAVPEPSSLAVILLASGAWLGSRRRRGV